MWNQLKAYRATVADRSILSLFEADAERAAAFSASFGDLLFDFSKTTIDAGALDLLLQLARDAGVAERRDAMFSGKKINETEGRAVLHTALRNLDGGPVVVDGADVMPEVLATLIPFKGVAGSFAVTIEAHGAALDCPGIGRLCALFHAQLDLRRMAGFQRDGHFVAALDKTFQR